MQCRESQQPGLTEDKKSLQTNIRSRYAQDVGLRPAFRNSHFP